MTTLLCQVTLVNANSIPSDAAVNTWHFDSHSVNRLDDAIAMETALKTFYDALDGILSEARSGDMVYKWYDLIDPMPRAPIRVENSTMGVTAGTKLPNEVAICLSYAGAPISGIPSARRRGRIFLGPWNATVMDEATGDARVASATMAAIASAAEALMDEGDTNRAWAVFSPTIAGAPPWTAGDILAATLDVVGGYVDNAFDTIRSRGAPASARENFS